MRWLATAFPASKLELAQGAAGGGWDKSGSELPHYTRTIKRGNGNWESDTKFKLNSIAENGSV